MGQSKRNHCGVKDQRTYSSNANNLPQRLSHLFQPQLFQAFTQNAPNNKISEILLPQKLG